MALEQIMHTVKAIILKEITDENKQHIQQPITELLCTNRFLPNLQYYEKTALLIANKLQRNKAYTRGYSVF